MDWLENIYVDSLEEPDRRNYANTTNRKPLIKNKKMAKAKTSYSKKPSFSKRGRTKEGNVSTTQGWSKKGESKTIKTVGYKTSKYGGGKRKMIITTIKKIC